MPSIRLLARDRWPACNSGSARGVLSRKFIRPFLGVDIFCNIWLFDHVADLFEVKQVDFTRFLEDYTK
jgi:hypothetical protein